MQKAAIGSLIILALVSSVGGESSQAVQDIQQVLADQVAAWNARNLDGF